MSNSKAWKNRKEELHQKEQLILEELNLKSSKTKKIILWSLGTGFITLIGYLGYRGISAETPKGKHKTKTAPTDWPMVDSAIENLAPSLGKWLLKHMKSK
jgi:hypothetical protein